VSTLQVTYDYSITHSSFKTFRTRSQQIKQKSWKVENTKLPESIYANWSPINISTLSSPITVERIFSKQQEFNLSLVIVDRRSFFMRRSALKVRSASQVVQPGNAICMRSKHELGSKLAKVRFSANSLKTLFGVELFKSVVLKVADIDPQGSIRPSKGLINSHGVEWGSLHGQGVNE